MPKFSDHHLLIGTIKIKLATAKQKRNPIQKKFNVAKIVAKKEETLTKYRKSLQVKFDVEAPVIDASSQLKHNQCNI